MKLNDMSISIDTITQNKAYIINEDIVNEVHNYCFYYFEIFDLLILK